MGFEVKSWQVLYLKLLKHTAESQARPIVGPLKSRSVHKVATSWPNLNPLLTYAPKASSRSPASVEEVHGSHELHVETKISVTTKLTSSKNSSS